ncbi:hypothetical protein Mapa_005033 [Marchantia paleacea]|nr:hypothetical protein Mapa_005033 [Marchantia paleacea]
MWTARLLEKQIFLLLARVFLIFILVVSTEETFTAVSKLEFAQLFISFQCKPRTSLETFTITPSSSHDDDHNDVTHLQGMALHGLYLHFADQSTRSWTSFRTSSKLRIEARRVSTESGKCERSESMSCDRIASVMLSPAAGDSHMQVRPAVRKGYQTLAIVF